MRVEISHKVGGLFFPDRMPGHPDYQGANDNLITAPAIREAVFLFHRIRQMPDWAAFNVMALITKEIELTINFIKERHSDGAGSD